MWWFHQRPPLMGQAELQWGRKWREVMVEQKITANLCFPPVTQEEELKEVVRSEMRDRCGCGGEWGRMLMERVAVILLSYNHLSKHGDFQNVAPDFIFTEPTIKSTGLEAAEINRQPQGYFPPWEHTKRDGESQEEMLNKTQSVTTLVTSMKPFMEPPPFIAASCLQPMDEGSCQNYVLLWYYHTESNTCRPFIFGGCRGNSNRFETKWRCERRCKTSADHVLPRVQHLDSPAQGCGVCRRKVGRFSQGGGFKKKGFGLAIRGNARLLITTLTNHGYTISGDTRVQPHISLIHSSYQLHQGIREEEGASLWTGEPLGRNVDIKSEETLRNSNHMKTIFIAVNQ
ncbi:hypothetical protein Q9233_013293 [Columba guinea]|nr:hypothetical protein Q9233_013293 [Columba guinea]